MSHTLHIKQRQPNNHTRTNTRHKSNTPKSFPSQAHSPIHPTPPQRHTTSQHQRRTQKPTLSNSTMHQKQTTNQMLRTRETQAHQSHPPTTTNNRHTHTHTSRSHNPPQSRTQRRHHRHQKQSRPPQLQRHRTTQPQPQQPHSPQKPQSSSTNLYHTKTIPQQISQHHRQHLPIQHTTLPTNRQTPTLQHRRQKSNQLNPNHTQTSATSTISHPTQTSHQQAYKNNKPQHHTT